MLDLVLKGGTVVDGTGSPGRRADVGIRSDRVVAVGEIDESATETIDITGLVIAPGFVDPHTHYDAQLFWDPAAASSSLHGVTSAMAGNCGFTLAPIAEKDADYTRRMMAKVEGMPLAALETGVPWNWSSFGEYLDRLDGNIGINVGFLVGHCALRRHVMGAESVGNEASSEQLAEMVKQLHASITAGGMGFSTTLSFTHSDGDGKPVSSRWASRDEVLALCAAVADHEGTTLEYVTDGCLQGFSDEEVDLMVEMSLAARRPLNWNVLTVDSAEPERYHAQLAVLEHATSRGARSVALTMPILVEMNMSFGSYCALFMLPDWSSVMSLPISERIEKLRDPEVRAHLLTRAQSPEAGVFSRLADWGSYKIGDVYAPENLALRGRRISEIANERGQSEFDTLLDIVIADELRTVLWPSPTDDDSASWTLRAQAWERDDVLLGGSDAGAHLDRMCGASYTTKFLGDCLRGRKLVSLERAVQMLTQEPANLFGLRDRGIIAEGSYADLVVFDPATIDAGNATTVNDLPGGTGRLNAESIGVKRVIVNGQTLVINGELTGNLPGKVLRSGRDTETVKIPADA